MLTFTYQATSNMQVSVNGSVWNLGALSGQRWANVTNSRARLKAALVAQPVDWTAIQTPANMIIATANAVSTPASGNSVKFADMASAMLNANSSAWMDFSGELADYMLDGVTPTTTTATTAAQTTTATTTTAASTATTAASTATTAAK